MNNSQLESTTIIEAATRTRRINTPDSLFLIIDILEKVK
jgi:hypothetical protein